MVQMKTANNDHNTEKQWNRYGLSRGDSKPIL